MGEADAEGATLNSPAEAYDKLGQQELSPEYLRQGLPVSREVGNRGVEGLIRSSLGTLYHKLGQPKRALEHLQAALAIEPAQELPEVVVLRADRRWRGGG